MNPITHLLVSWVVADSAGLERRERVAATLAGIVPDVDSFGIVAEQLTKNSAKPLLWWSDYHHVLGHNIGFGMLVAAVAFFVSKNKWKTAGIALLCFHLHLLGDVVGARGPDGYQWPIPYLLPFSSAFEIAWKHQWEINAWPNVAITATALVLAFFYAWKHGYSVLQLFSGRADRAFVESLRKRFGEPVPAISKQR